MDQSLPPHCRFHDGRDYGRVFHRQQKAAGPHLVVLLAPRSKRAGRQARLGIMVGTKVAKLAVRRHQLKRWVRELFRTRLKEPLHGWDLVVLFRRDPPADGHAAIDAEILRLIDKARQAEARPGSRPRRS